MKTASLHHSDRSSPPNEAALGVSLSRPDAIPLQVQLYQQLRRLIAEGALAPGARLPASRTFAAELLVSRTTVVAAYDQLEAEGYVAARRSAGVFVAAHAALGHLPEPAPKPRPRPGPTLRTVPTLRPGAPDPRLMPHREFARIAARVWRSEPSALGEFADPFGDPVLRGAICERILTWRGAPADPGRLIVTAGAIDALELCFEAICAPGDAVAFESPGYPPAWAAARSRGLETQAVPVGPDGLDTDALWRLTPTPKALLLTPSVHYPLGVSLSAGRRHDVLEWSRRTGAVVLEDDYGGEFRYEGRPVPALAGLPGAERVIYIGSFSKVFSNGLRLGYAMAPPDLLADLGRGHQRRGARASATGQRPLARFIETGAFGRHVRRMRRAYAERRRVLLEAVSSSAASTVLSLAAPDAGMAVVADLRPDFAPGFRDFEISARIAEISGVETGALSATCLDGRGPRRLLLGFAAFTPEEIEAATSRFAAALGVLAEGVSPVPDGPGRV